jgi:hypothetical protein
VAPHADLARLSSAFEVPFTTVLDDVALVRMWRRPAAELLELLSQRHAWDASVAPHYVRWILRVSQTHRA